MNEYRDHDPSIAINPDKGELLLGQEHRPRRPKCLRPFDPAMDGAGFVLQL
jgi:hypothetical protein